MRADEARTLFDYHIMTNRRIWDESIAVLTDAQFIQPLDYSVGSIRNQAVHLMSVDERWFSGLRGVELPAFLNPVHYPDRPRVRLYWDRVESEMREYLAVLRDEQLDESMQGIPVWQVLQHVLLHGMDHRAQMLAMLHGLGAPTFPQDFFFYLRKAGG